MTEEKNKIHEDSLNDVEETGIISEFWEFLCENKKFWLIPILLFFLLIGLFCIFTSTSAAPFIYTLF